MPEIIWSPYQEEHITARHGVTAEEFEQAWCDREDIQTLPHPYGPYFLSFGLTDVGRELDLVWRWNGTAVWPITAYDYEGR